MDNSKNSVNPNLVNIIKTKCLKDESKLEDCLNGNCKLEDCLKDGCNIKDCLKEGCTLEKCLKGECKLEDCLKDDCNLEDCLKKCCNETKDCCNETKDGCKMEDCLKDGCNMEDCLKGNCDIKDCLKDGCKMEDCLKGNCDMEDCLKDDCNMEDCLKGNCNMEDCLKGNCDMEDCLKNGCKKYEDCKMNNNIIIENNLITKTDNFEYFTNECTNLFGNINKHFNNLNSQIVKLNNKVDNIKTLCASLNDKKSLYTMEHINNLVFQANLLSGDINYLSGLRKTFLHKMHNDVFNLANNIILFISSITNIEIDDNDKEKNHIIKKVTTIKKINDINIKLVETYLGSILNNLELVNQVGNNFNQYIKKMNDKITNENFHCNNLNITLNNKKDNILLEYEKNKQCILKLLQYYSSLCNNIGLQLDNLKISQFCLNN